jgi:PKD repeat protein
MKEKWDFRSNNRLFSRKRSLWKETLIGILALLLVPFVGEVRAAQVYVPDNYATIQAAIEAVSAGDEVVVRPGNYDDIMFPSDKAITVRSEDGPEATFIRQVGFRGSSTIDGFTITELGDSDHWSNGQAGDMWVNRCSDLSSNGGGGGVFCESGSPVIRNCIIAGHEGEYFGGVYCGPNTAPTFESCIIRYNHGGMGVGGIMSSNASPTFTNCIINRNAGNMVGAILACDSSELTFINCTVADNAAATATTGLGPFELAPSMCLSGVCGGIALMSSSSATVINSIFWNDKVAYCLHSSHGTSYSRSSEIALYDETCSIDFTYSNIERLLSPWGEYYWELLPEGIGNINRDPEFAGDVDYHMDTTSPCIDAGNNSATGLPGLDFEGNPRVINGNDDGTATVDMGAYEMEAFDPNRFTADFAVDPPIGPATTYAFQDPLTVQFTDLTSDTVTEWLWDFGDGETSTEQNPSHAFYTGNCWGGDFRGDYKVSLTTTGPNGSDSRIVEHGVRATDVPEIMAIEPNETPKPGQEIMIVGLFYRSYEHDTQGDSSVTIGDTVYGPGHPDILQWDNVLVRVLVPNYGCSVFGDNPSITRDVTVTIGKHITSNEIHDEITSKPMALTIERPVATMEVIDIKVLDMDVSPPVAKTDFSPGTNLRFSVDAKVTACVGSDLYRLKLRNTKLVLTYLPVGDPNRTVQLLNPDTGKKFRLTKNIASGETATAWLEGQLPSYAQVGKNFRFIGTLELQKMGDSTVIQSQDVTKKGCNIVP